MWPGITKTKPTTKYCGPFCAASANRCWPSSRGWTRRPGTARSYLQAGRRPGCVEHLGGAEWHWFQGVVAGKQPELPGDLAKDQPPYDPLSVVFTTDTPSAEVVTFYRNQCAQSEAVLAITPLSAPPLGKHGRYEPPNVRWVVLHMIEETARHAGHLDIARELLDGTTRLGGR